MKRRTKITLAGAVSAVLVALISWLSVNAAHGAAKISAATWHHPMLYGMNAHYYTGQFGMTSLRYFVRGVPSTFPGQGQMTVPPGITPIVSMNVDLTAFAAGQYDAATRHYLSLAVPGTLITVKHEANNHFQTISPQTYKAAIRRLAALAQGYPVRVGQIFGTYPVVKLGQDLADWTVPGLSFYGIDCYQRTASETPALMCGKAYTQIASAAPSGAIGITETNSNVNPAAWARAVYPWAASQPRVRLFAWFTCVQASYCDSPLPMPPAWLVAADARLSAAP
jgi:hypothetical protein